MLLCCLTGCQQPASLPAAPEQTSAPYTPLHLQEGDVVKITFEGDTNMNTLAKVQLDGSISAPVVGDVKAAGKTPQELQSDLMKRYEPLLKVNEVMVSVASNSASVYVSGAVLRPGRIPMERPLTALDAIMEAGGFEYTRAKLSSVTVLRLENGRQRRYKLNLKRTMNGQDPSPFYLKPFDTIHVPEKTFNY